VQEMSDRMRMLCAVESINRRLDEVLQRMDGPPKRRAEEADRKTAEYETAEKMLNAGVPRPQIAKEMGITYSRLTYIKWHIDYGVGAIPGMETYDLNKKREADVRYKADVAAKRSAKAAKGDHGRARSEDLASTRHSQRRRGSVQLL
jgi:hypothetical protein